MEYQNCIPNLKKVSVCYSSVASGKNKTTNLRSLLGIKTWNILLKLETKE